MFLLQRRQVGEATGRGGCFHWAQPGECRHLPNEARALTLRRQPPLSWTRCVRWGSAAVGPAVHVAGCGSLAYPTWCSWGGGEAIGGWPIAPVSPSTSPLPPTSGP